MTALDENAVRRIFRNSLESVPGIPSREFTIYENRGAGVLGQDRNIGTNDIYLMEMFRILSEDRVATGTIQILGQALFTIFFAEGKGTKPMETLALEIAKAFESGTVLTNTEVCVQIVRSVRGPVVSSEVYPHWVVKTVTVDWRSFVSSSTTSTS